MRRSMPFDPGIKFVEVDKNLSPEANNRRSKTVSRELGSAGSALIVCVEDEMSQVSLRGPPIALDFWNIANCCKPLACFATRGVALCHFADLLYRVAFVAALTKKGALGFAARQTRQFPSTY